MIDRVASPRGRPRTFDRDRVLRQAMLTFWGKGYEGTSMSDLVKSMGIMALPRFPGQIV